MLLGCGCERWRGAQKAFRLFSMNTSMAGMGDDSSFEDNNSCSPKYFLFAAGITNEVLVSCINGGIIVYTRLASDTYQTLVNKMYVLSCLYNIAMYTCLFVIVVPGSLCLSLPYEFCWVHSFVATLLALQIILISNEIPFLFFLVMKGIKLMVYIDEAFGVRMVSLFNFLISAFYALAINLMFCDTLMTFKFCTQNPDMVPIGAGHGDTIISSLCGFSILHHFLAGVGMYMYKKKATSVVHPNIQVIHGAPPPSTAAAVYKSSLSDQATYAISSTATLLASAVMTAVLATPGSNLFSMVGKLRIMFMLSLLLFLPACVYVRKKQLRDTLWREAKKFMGKN